MSMLYNPGVGYLYTRYGELTQDSRIESMPYPSVGIRDMDYPPVVPQNFSREIARGIRLLNERKPGWFHSIQGHNLDVANGCYCILGQVYGSYERGKEELGISFAEAAFHGFCLAERSYYPQWTQLTMQWRVAIFQLQQEEQPPVVEEEKEEEKGAAIKHIEASICQYQRAQEAEANLRRYEMQRAFNPYSSQSRRSLDQWYSIAPPGLWNITFDEIDEEHDRPQALTETQQPERIEVRELCPA